MAIPGPRDALALTPAGLSRQDAVYLDRSGLGAEADDLPVVAELGGPVTFAGRVGWLHWPRRPRSKDRARTPGVVLCSAIGRDEGCSHVTMRLLAEALAREGFPVLRYDHLGCGDSLDLPDDIDALPVWREGVDLAIEHLKQLTGVRSVVLGGFRFGASLAMLAANRADALILLAPILDGGRWTRELCLRAALGAAPADAEDRGLESDGLHLSSATLASLKGLDLTQAGAIGPQVLCFSPKPAAARLDSIGAETGRWTIAPFDGYAALLEDPDANQVPESVLKRAVAWMDRTYPMEAGAQTLATAWRPGAPKAVLTPPGCEETQVCFGQHQTLRGVLCAPQRADGRAVLIFNTGGEPRRGVGRLSVQVARALALRGVASLRVDLAGIGDSPTGDGQHDHGHTPIDVFETPRGGDIDAAVVFLGGLGLSRITAMGVCSGGYHALKAALEDDRIDEAFVINPGRLIEASTPAGTQGRRDRGRSASAYLARAHSWNSWLRLITGQIDLGAVGRTLAVRLSKRLHIHLNRRPADALLEQLAALSRRGGRVAFVIGADDVSLDEAQACFGPKGERLERLPGISMRIEPNLDHAVCLASSRASIIEALLAFMDPQSPHR
jgi:dienelactone hydrolase